MKDNITAHPKAPGKQLQRISLAVLLIAFIFSARNLYADNLDACFLEALKTAHDSVTVGQLRERCRQETGTSSTAPPPEDSSGIEESSPVRSNGPEEMILQTSQARKPAYFPHKKHQEKFTCGTCHHGTDPSGRLAQYTEATIITKCTACHNTDMPNEELNDFQLIGHKLCRECHRKNQDITSARCSTCHRTKT